MRRSGEKRIEGSLISYSRPLCDELEVAVSRNADGAFTACLPDRHPYPAVKIAISSPSGDTLKLATLPSRFATETTRHHTRLNTAPFSFHWPPIGYSFVARRSRCGGASFHPSGHGKVARHETFTKFHEKTTAFGAASICEDKGMRDEIER